LPDRARSAELAALTTIAAQVNCTQNLDEILSGALETTLEVMGVDAGEVFLINEETGELILHAHQGLSETFLSAEAVFALDECICGLSAESRQPVMAVDIATHPARSRPACLREGFRSLLCLPLLVHGQVLGLLNVQSRSSRQFTPEDEELLTAIGNQIGIAIANAQLIDDAEQRRATLDSVMNSLVDGLILVDRRGRIAYANPYAEEVLDLPAPMLTGRPVEAMEGEIARRVVDWESVSRLIQTATSDIQDTPAVEIALIGSKPRILQVRFFPIHGPGGDSLGLGLLLHDITRERELDEMKSQLLSTVSHELRTPLASIKGFATTLLRQDVEWDEATRREFLAIIDEESDRLSELISNLLDMSRIEAGTLRVEAEPTDLLPIVQETVAEFRLITHDHRFEAHLPPSLPLVPADPRRIRQVLRNLMENAVKYSPGGGPVTVSCSREASGEQTPDDSIQVSVADQGLGIEPEHLGRIFDRFYQVDSASTREVRGAGLGLSICKAIVEAHHGRIWAESQAGVGSTFCFTLPLKEGDHG
jgi:signal transduction histidine kinase/putative methionine-R-sulfoxide reductase with GAF domain